jgi:hypothetical protein
VNRAWVALIDAVATNLCHDPAVIRATAALPNPGVEKCFAGRINIIGKNITAKGSNDSAVRAAGNVTITGQKVPQN